MERIAKVNATALLMAVTLLLENVMIKQQDAKFHGQEEIAQCVSIESGRLISILNIVT